MSLTAVTSNALSALQASQSGMRATSNNISNINTPGYARQEVQLAHRVAGSVGAGVDVEGVQRVTDRFLTATSLTASARAAAAEVGAGFMDRAQSAFGDPSGGLSVFDDVSRSFASFAAASGDPASPVRRSSAVADVELTLDQFHRLGKEVQDLRAEAATRVTGAVDRVNALLQEISDLNADVVRGQFAGDPTGPENARAQVIDELASLVDVRVNPLEGGAVEVRTTGGALLVGVRPARLSYEGAGIAHPGSSYPPIQIQIEDAPPQDLDGALRGGELRALIDLRDVELPAVARQVGELAAGFAEAINAAHNQAVAVPAPRVLSGRDTGLLPTDAIGFTGQTSLAVLDTAGALTNRFTIDFDAGSITSNTGAVFNFGGDLASFETALDGALGSVGGSANFANGQLTLTGPAGRGLAFDDPDTGAAARAGRGFSHTFGLNDLVTSPTPLDFSTGITVGAPHGLGTTPNERVEMRLLDARGGEMRTVTVTPVAGQTWNDFLNGPGGLNDPVTGLGEFGTFVLSAPDGALTFQPAPAAAAARLEVVGDTTQRGDTRQSFTRLFGLGEAPRADRAFNLAVREDIVADPGRLAFATVDGATIGDVVTGAGDGSGAQLLQAAGSSPRRFEAAGGLPAATGSLLDYAGRVGADIGRRADQAQRTADSASALRQEAEARRSSVEGVNLDEEIVKLNQFQQSFQAASRLIQASEEMFDILLSMSR